MHGRWDGAHYCKVTYVRDTQHTHIWLKVLTKWDGSNLASYLICSLPLNVVLAKDRQKEKNERKRNMQAYLG